MTIDLRSKARIIYSENWARKEASGNEEAGKLLCSVDDTPALLDNGTTGGRIGAFLLRGWVGMGAGVGDFDAYMIDDGAVDSGTAPDVADQHDLSGGARAERGAFDW